MLSYIPRSFQSSNLILSSSFLTLFARVWVAMDGGFPEMSFLALLSKESYLLEMKKCWMQNNMMILEPCIKPEYPVWFFFLTHRVCISKEEGSYLVVTRLQSSDHLTSFRNRHSHLIECVGDGFFLKKNQRRTCKRRNISLFMTLHTCQCYFVIANNISNVLEHNPVHLSINLLYKMCSMQMRIHLLLPSCRKVKLPFKYSLSSTEGKSMLTMKYRDSRLHITIIKLFVSNKNGIIIVFLNAFLLLTQAGLSFLWFLED